MITSFLKLLGPSKDNTVACLCYHTLSMYLLISYFSNSSLCSSLTSIFYVLVLLKMQDFLFEENFWQTSHLDRQTDYCVLEEKIKFLECGFHLFKASLMECYFRLQDLQWNEFFQFATYFGIFKKFPQMLFYHTLISNL